MVSLTCLSETLRDQGPSRSGAHPDQSHIWATLAGGIVCTNQEFDRNLGVMGIVYGLLPRYIGRGGIAQWMGVEANDGRCGWMRYGGLLP